MGTKQSLSYKPPSLKRQNWKDKIISRRNDKPDHGKYKVLVGNLNNEEIEQYGVNFHNLAEFQKYVQFFEWRSREDCIVNSKYLNYELSKEFCNTNYSAKVYIEHIPVRLSDIQDIPYPENLNVLFSALDGFQKLYHSVGYFKISEDLICMDKDGKVKVWLNPDLSKCYTIGGNFSDEVNNYRKSEILQEAMVGQIVKIIETNTTDDIDPEETITEFIWHNHKSKGIGFKSMKQQVINYAQKYNTDIPNYFDSVIGIFEQVHDNDQAQAHNLINQPYQNQNDKSQERAEDQYYQQHQQFQSYPERQTVKVLNHIPYNQSYQYNSGSVDNHRAKVKANNIIEQRPYSSSIPLQIGSINNTNLKVKFNYQNHFALSPQSYMNPISPIMQLVSRNPQKTVRPPVSDDRHQYIEEQYTDPKLQLSSSLKNLLNNNKLFYSDSTCTYELDEEIAHDMIKYLSAQG